MILETLDLVYVDGTTATQAPTTIERTIAQGADVELPFAVEGSDGQAVNVSAWTLVLSISTTKDAEPILQQQIDGADGKFVLASSDTRDWTAREYWVDVWGLDASSKYHRLMEPSQWTVDNSVFDPDGAVTPVGEDQVLTGLPIPDAADVGRALVLTDDDPVTLDWKSRPSLATFANSVDYTNDTITFTTIASSSVTTETDDTIEIEVDAQVALLDNTVQGAATFDIEIDGNKWLRRSFKTYVYLVDGGLANYWEFSGGIRFGRVVTGLSAGAHTITVKGSWSGTAGGGQGISIPAPTGSPNSYTQGARVMVKRFPA